MDLGLTELSGATRITEADMSVSTFILLLLVVGVVLLAFSMRSRKHGARQGSDHDAGGGGHGGGRGGCH